MAPIALYPDPLLAQVLAASTYPLEIVQLQQWIKKNPGLKDKALADAVKKQPWDASIQSMAAMPELVDRLANDIQWTTDLGNAFLAQQKDVMDAVQRMRKKAQDKGTLTSNEQQKVSSETVESGQQVIVIQQANPEIVYVPSYSPVVVYGAPMYPYPPIYYPYYPPGAAFVTFTFGFAMGAWMSGGWGYGCGWGGNNVYINHNNNFVGGAGRHRRRWRCGRRRWGWWRRRSGWRGWGWRRRRCGRRGGVGGPGKPGGVGGAGGSLAGWAEPGGGQSNWQHSPNIAAAHRTRIVPPRTASAAARVATRQPAGRQAPGSRSRGRAVTPRVPWTGREAARAIAAALGGAGDRGNLSGGGADRGNFSGGGADRAGSRDLSRSSSSSNRSAFGGGGSYNGSRAGAAGSRGSSSFGGRGGGARGGGGGRRR